MLRLRASGPSGCPSLLFEDSTWYQACGTESRWAVLLPLVAREWRPGASDRRLVEAQFGGSPGCRAEFQQGMKR